ncbi:hypothetical protein ACLB90_04305 [Stenotrophomonas sp. LGBM10]|uniref:hypothetical protein n=1 Tax=Stenotrophomonas sp. LGBM10 TaxID=3390038 RepID=UPI00398AACC2
MTRLHAASGHYVIRIRVLSRLKAKVRRAFPKRSLGVDLLSDRAAAFALPARYVAAVTAMQKMGMSKEPVHSPLGTQLLRHSGMFDGIWAFKKLLYHPSSGLILLRHTSRWSSECTTWAGSVLLKLSCGN